MLEPNELDKIIELGKQEESNIDHFLATLHASRETYMLPWNEWEQIAKASPDSDLGFLTKGLAIAEARLKWQLGSVSPAGWLIKVLSAKNLELSTELAEWVASYWGKLGFSNSYAPFPKIAVQGKEQLERIRKLKKMRLEIENLEGFLEKSLGETSWLARKKDWLNKEVIELKEKQAVQNRLDALESRLAEKEKSLTRLEKQLEKAQEEILRIQIKHRREKILQKGQCSDSLEKLRLVASSALRIGAFPEDWGKVGDEVLLKLDDKTRSQLLKILGERRKGVWAELKNRLSESR